MSLLSDCADACYSLSPLSLLVIHIRAASSSSAPRSINLVGLDKWICWPWGSPLMSTLLLWRSLPRTERLWLIPLSGHETENKYLVLEDSLVINWCCLWLSSVEDVVTCEKVVASPCESAHYTATLKVCHVFDKHSREQQWCPPNRAWVRRRPAASLCRISLSGGETLCCVMYKSNIPDMIPALWSPWGAQWDVSWPISLWAREMKYFREISQTKMLVQIYLVPLH